jgi:hypothetical protein
MSNPTTDTSGDWLSSKRSNLLAWWIPNSAILASLFAPVSLRTAVWVIALGWMGAACIMNARRCNRTHCRYTGPYFIAMIAPVIALGAALVTVGVLGWICLGVIILGGAGLIWWASERAWGKFS